jgi:arylsulfatase A-like enzyme
LIAAALFFSRPVIGPGWAAAAKPGARLLILVVWDGLRPDSVTSDTTPNLYALEHEGVYFADHHSMFPSLTMVNSASLASGTPAAANGIIANSMYIAPLLDGVTVPPDSPLAKAKAGPVSLEHTKLLEALSGADGLKGGVVQVRTVAQELWNHGGFIGIVGKSGPTFLFDDRVSGDEPFADGNEIFVSDDHAAPLALAQQLRDELSQAALAAALHQPAPFGDQDALLGQIFLDHALPGAASALKANRSGLLVLWQHNPDISQHLTGVGTSADLKVLGICDHNLGKLRAAIAQLGIADKTDLIVLSDHGFATVKVNVDLTGLLIAQGLKQSAKSDDVVVARNFGVDTIYLSPRFDRIARNRLLQKIVNFAATQDWCGPIFSRPLEGASDNSYQGAIAGTFNQAWFDLFNPTRSADLIISFRELAEEDNSRLNGPDAKAFVLDATGMRSQPNRSLPIIHPMAGVAYADATHLATTGEGTHGSLGKYEMHSFCAATGPDFRHAWIDHAPTSNLDVARTIAALLRLPSAMPAAKHPLIYGRAMTEAFGDGETPGAHRHTPVSVRLDLPDRHIVSTIDMEQLGREKYLTGSEVRRY